MFASLHDQPAFPADDLVREMVGRPRVVGEDLGGVRQQKVIIFRPFLATRFPSAHPSAAHFCAGWLQMTGARQPSGLTTDHS